MFNVDDMFLFLTCCSSLNNYYYASFPLSTFILPRPRIYLASVPGNDD